MNIDVGICAFRRLSILDTLQSVARQSLPPEAKLRTIVAENDDLPRLRDRIKCYAAEAALDLHYVHAPARNISVARNACLKAAEGDLLVFIDDDEVADPEWIGRLLQARAQTEAGVVFGPALAIYPPSAPRWICDNDFHSNIPARNGDVVETGFSCNVLLDRRDARIRDARFSLAFGRTGGEDVEFFFRLHRVGVRKVIAEDAIVREPVAPERLSFRWIIRRKHITGSIYGFCARPGVVRARAGFVARALAKATYCGLRAAVAVTDRARCSFWIMRGSFHAGVVSGCVVRPSREVYGQEP